MPPKKKALAPSGAAVIPFDPETQDLILDLKGLCRLPFELEMSAVTSFRALILPKGRYVHEPKKAGKYLVLGNFRSTTALCLVHFDPSMQRDPELLLDFQDYGLANAMSMHVPQVETVMLPLLVSQGVYSKAIRQTEIKDIVGFEPINTSALPYSKDLGPFLKTNELYSSFKIASQSDLLAHINKPLCPRLAVLEKTAQADLARHLAGIAKDDASSADDQRSGLETRLADMIAKLKGLPPENYDAPLTARIKTIAMVDPPEHEAAEHAVPEWLNTPLKAALAEGSAKPEFTRFGSPVRMTTRSQPSPKGLVDDDDDGDDGDDDDGDDDDGDDDDGDDDDEDDDSDAAEESTGEEGAASTSELPAKRQRLRVEFYAPLASVGKSKVSGKKQEKPAKAPKQPSSAKTSADKKKDRSCPPGVDPLAPFGRNRKGKPYKRSCGAYNASLIPKPAHPNADAQTKCVSELKEANRLLTEQLKDALEKLATATAKGDSAVKLARAEESAAKHEAYHTAYMAGLNKGLEIASGGRIVATPQSAGGTA